MDRRRIRCALALAAAAAAAAALPAAPAAAQPAPEPGAPGDAPGDAPIEMEPEPAAPPAADAPAAKPAPVKDPKAARKWLAAAQQLVQRGDALTRAKKLDDARASYENAVTALQRALDTGEDPSPHAQLGDVYVKLGKPDLAARHYRVVVRATGVRPEVQRRATARLEEVARQVGIVTLNVKPEGAVIALAGTELGKAPLPEPLILLPGTYTVALQAEGFQPKEAEIVVEAGAETERAIELEAVQIIVQAPPKEETPAPPPAPAPGPSRLPLYVGGGAAIALLGAATVTGILAIGEHDTFTAVGSTPAQRADAKSAGERLALLTDVSIAAGVVAGGFTAYWYFVKYRPAQRKWAEARPRGATAKVDVIPWVQGPSSGLSLVGAF